MNNRTNTLVRANPWLSKKIQSMMANTLRLNGEVGREPTAHGHRHNLPPLCPQNIYPHYSANSQLVSWVNSSRINIRVASTLIVCHCSYAKIFPCVVRLSMAGHNNTKRMSLCLWTISSDFPHCHLIHYRRKFPLEKLQERLESSSWKQDKKVLDWISSQRTLGMF